MKFRILLILLFSTWLCSACSNQTAKQHLNTEVGTQIIADNDSSNTEMSQYMSEEITPQILSKDASYNTTNHSIEIIGFKEFKNLKTELYDDIPADGNVFLVVYLKYQNYTENNEYFNPEYLISTLDGAKISTTALVNDPDGYSTFFTNLSSNSTYYGYLAWEVPKDWKELQVTYKGWENSDSIDLNIKLVPKDLFDIKTEE